MRPSLVAHNHVLNAFAREKRWHDSMSLLLRMRQLGLKPDTSSIAATMRAAVGAPGSSQLALKLKDWQLALLLRLCMQHLQQAIPRTVKTARWRLLLRRRRRLQYGNYSSTGKRRPRRPSASS